MATSQQMVTFLVSVGIMPSDAEKIVATADARGHKPFTVAISNRRSGVTEADKERARIWWYYTPTVPTVIRRILDAPDITED